MYEKSADMMLQKYEKALSVRREFEELYDEIFEYCLPQRQGFKNYSAGQRRDDKIFDETAVVGIQEFASRLQSGLTPNFARWADFVTGSEVPEEERDDVNNALDGVTDYVFEILQTSNFAQEIHECFIDLALGTAVLLVTEGDAVNPIRFQSIPLPHVVLDTGPDGRVDHVYRERLIKNEDILIAYPKATLTPKMVERINNNPDAHTKILEVSCKLYDKPNEERYSYMVIDVADKQMIMQELYTGVGSNPFIAFRWSKASGEIYGRGPAINALSAIKTCNLTIELVLENAQMAISGIYQIDDDGVINVDTINLVPGTVIPKAPNTQGLQPIRAAGSFDVANLVLNDMRNNIKRALYNDMLGDPNKTPASATEVAERMADLSRKIGSAFGRLQAEMVQPVLQRVIYILKKQGRIEMPVVNGREVKIRSVSPLAQAQSNQDIVSLNRFLQTVANSFGPEILNILISSEETALYLAKKFGVPDNLIRDADERRQLIEMAQQVQQMQQQGEIPDATALGG
tara:strand:- start:1200 stop:2747 length:1548 start_codon:yes stop_codon:yes gene_type:complete